MSEPAITPLAQRLAEENNVDWRSLQGSGEGGRIVERDVLEYLARVMAGDEAVNPTPEPLPAGLEEWPEADGWGSGPTPVSAAASWEDEADSDDSGSGDLDWPAGDEARELGTPVAFDAEEAELRATGEYPAVTDGLSAARNFADDLAADEPFGVEDDDDGFELSEDIFLFGDDGSTGTDGAADNQADLPGLDDPLPPERPYNQSLAQDDLDDLAEEGLFLSEDPEGVLDDGPEPAVYLDEDPEDDLSVMEDLEVEPEEDLLGRTDDLLDDNEFEDADLTDLAFEDGELDEPGLADDSLGEFESGFSFDSLEQQADAGEAVDDSLTEEPELGGDYASLQDRDGLGTEHQVAGQQQEGDEFDVDFLDLVEDDAAADSWQDAVEFAAEVQGDGDEQDEAESLARRIEAAFESVADARPEFESFGEDSLAEDAPEPVSADDEDAGATAGDTVASDAPFPWSTEGDEASQPFLAPLASADSSVDAEESDGLPFASFGTLLRRQLDVSQLNQARSLVGAEISGGDNVSALTFLLLAARRAAAQTGTFAGEGSVAAVIIRDSELELVQDSQQGFRSLAQQLQQVSEGRDPDAVDLDNLSLAVADMSELEVDEAVLDLGLPMLSLGRSLHDEDRNTFRSTITLSGHFDLQEGARFLQAASELLANPLRLLL